MEIVINTISQKIVPPSKIESELFKIWDSLTKENKIRANLFNLIVVTPLNQRYDQIRALTQKLIEKFPCRIIFVTIDLKSNASYYKSAVSVVFPDEKEPTVACDHIDIALAGNDIEKVPFLILPHLLPDLPVYLLWPQSEKKYSSILKELQTFVHRVIFDSECFDTIYQFASFVCQTKKDFPQIDIADLNWIQLEGYKQCLATEFYAKSRFEKLKQASNISIYYSLGENQIQDQIQSMYLQGWLSQAMDLTHIKTIQKDQTIEISYEPGVTFKIIGQTVDLSFGSIVNVVIQTKKKETFSFSRNLQHPESLKIDIKNPIQCELPYYYLMGKIESNLSNEITNKGTSSHFLETLTYLLKQS